MYLSLFITVPIITVKHYIVNEFNFVVLNYFNKIVNYLFNIMLYVFHTIIFKCIIIYI